jgi:choline dehydrogenase-like flavoprotein
MLIDARTLPEGALVQGDVCIIGAGAAGITLARELAAAQRAVVLLESGDFVPDARTQALYDGKVVGLPLDPTLHIGLDVPRLRYFGGSTNHWAGYCRPLTDLDFETRPYVDRSGWPFGRDHLLPYYARAHDVLKLGPPGNDWRPFAEAGLIEPPLLEDPATPHEVVQLTNNPRLGPLYHDEIVSSPYVQLHTWSNVTELAAAPDGTQLDHVFLKTLRGNTFTVRAKAYVLATGGLEVPRMLLASNAVHRNGLGNEHDLVGRFFMEHVNILAGVALLNAEPASVISNYEPREHAIAVDGEQRTIWLQSVLLPAAEQSRARGLASIEFTISDRLAEDPSGERINARFAGTDDAAELLRAFGTPAGSAVPLRVLCEQEPNPRSRLTLTSERDELGIAKPQLDWRLTRNDRESLLRSMKFLGGELGRRGVGRVKLDIYGFTDADAGPGDDIGYEVNTGSHHMGTARMHASPRQGVVDPRGKVHGIANLYIAGSAVFPTSGASTPTITIVALALRLADHLRDRVLA